MRCYPQKLLKSIVLIYALRPQVIQFQNMGKKFVSTYIIPGLVLH